MEKEKLVLQTHSVTVNVTANKIDSYRSKEETLNTVRVYEDGKIGVAGSLGEIDEGSLDKAAKKALSYCIEYPCELTDKSGTEENAAEIIPEKEFIPQMQSFVDKLAVQCPRFTFSDKIKLAGFRQVYENSRGAKLVSSSDWLDISLIFQDKGAGNLFDGSYEGITVKYDEEEAVKDCKLMYDAFYNPVDIAEGEYPVFMIPDSFFGTTLSHFYGNMYASGASLLSGKIGERAFNERLSLFDDRNPETDPTACFFDDEGEFAPDFRQPLIKNGVLTNVLTCKMYSEKLNLPFAATAAAVYDGVPGIGFSGAFVQPTAKTVSEITNDKAVLVMMASGGDMTPSGHYATPVQLAFLVENGVIKGRLPEIGISGEYFDMLGKDYLGAVEKAFFPSINKSFMAFGMKVTK